MQSREGSTFAQLQTVRQMHYADVEAGYANVVKGLPRVVVWGEKDRVTSLRMGKKVAAAVDAPLVIIPASGHVPIIERPTPVITAIAEVLRQADAAGPRAQPIAPRPKAGSDDDDDDNSDDVDTSTTSPTVVQP